MKLLVYAANLHVGGGIQVATSFIFELAKRREEMVDVTIWASSSVDANLRELGFDAKGFAGYEVIDHQGIRARFSPDRHRVSDFDGVFVVFGPHYLGQLGGGGVTPAVVMGFAQGGIIYPDSEVYTLMPGWQRLLTQAKFFIQAHFFKRADQLIVELEHVRQGLIRRSIGEPDRISIVNNCIASVYLEPEQWLPVELPPRGARLRLGFVGRNYIHKNTRIFPAVLTLLRQKYQLDVEMLVTFKPSEWKACGDEFRSVVLNAGELTLAQCPAFYQSLDAVVFPSLLECFSATPLESMVMEKPLFASDRAFVRDICGDFAEYFDPLNPQDVARVIATGLAQPADATKISLARRHAIEFSSAEGRALSYLKILRETTRKLLVNRSTDDV